MNTYANRQTIRCRALPHPSHVSTVRAPTHCRRAKCAANASNVTSYTPPSSVSGASEADLLSKCSTVVPDAMAALSEEKMNAATVSFNVLRAIITQESLGLKPLENAITAARAFDKDVNRQVEKAFANVGAILADQVSGRISNEIDPRLAHDTDAMVAKAVSLAKLYKELGVPASRLLFRIPATWEGIAAVKKLESQGLSSHVFMVYSLVQGVAAAQAGASLVNPNVGRTREWFNKHPGVIRDPSGPRQDAGLPSGVDPGVQLVTQLYNYIKAYHPRTAILASGLRSREDALALAGCDYLLLPAKVIAELRSVPTTAGYNDGLHAAGGSNEDVLADFIKLSPQTAAELAPAKMQEINQSLFNERLGVAGKDLLALGLKDAIKDVEALASLSKATTGTSST